MKKILFFAFVLLAVFAGVQEVRAEQPAPVLPTLTSEAYATMQKDEVYVVMFSAVYCGPCRVAKQELFPELMEKYKTDKNVHFFVLDVDQDVPASNGTFLKDQWSADGLPTFVVVYNDAVMYSKKGYSSKIKTDLKKALEAKINALK